jgi:hypothetical protein
MRVGSVAVITSYQSLPVRMRLAVNIYWPLLTARVTIPIFALRMSVSGPEASSSLPAREGPL